MEQLELFEPTNTDIKKEIDEVKESIGKVHRNLFYRMSHLEKEINSLSDILEGLDDDFKIMRAQVELLESVLKNTP